MRKIRLLIFVAITLLSPQCYGQVNQTPGPDPAQLPDVSAQGIFTGNNYSVDMFTGIATVNIPIYNYSIDGLDLGISLSYNCKGIPVDATASSEGLGFTLNAGGYITREVNDLEDEVALDVNPSYYFYCSGILMRNVPVFATGDTDKEYDIFTAQFGSRSVKFMVTGSGVYTMPKSNLNIQMILPYDSLIGVSNTQFMSFIITDEQGNKFRFDKGDVQAKPANGILPAYNSVAKWVLDTVTTYSGQVITYSYDYFNPSPFIDFNNQQVFESAVTSPASIVNVNANSDVWRGTFSHVSAIHYPDGTIVDFNMIGTPGRLDLDTVVALANIAIKKGYDNNVNDSITYQFNYAYFNTPLTSSACPTFENTEVPYAYAPNPSQTQTTYFNCLMATGISSAISCEDYCQVALRLKLKSITKIGTDGITTEPYYTFNYNATPLPQRLSPSQDWYGFYNNHASSLLETRAGQWYLGVPQHAYYDSVAHANSTYGVDRTPDINYMQADMLTEVINANGGKMDLYYKAHTLSNVPSSAEWHPLPTYFQDTGTYDGLCIDKIVYNDGYNADNVDTTTFSFSGGLRFFEGELYWYPTFYSANPLTNITAANTRWTYFNKALSPIDYFNNSNHGYSYATVTNKGYQGEVLSKDIYHFSNIVDASGKSDLDNDQTKYYYHTFPRAKMTQYKMGLLLDKRSYGNSDTPVSKVVYVYDTAKGQTLPTSTRYYFYAYDSSIFIDTTSTTRTYDPFENSFCLLSNTYTTKYSVKDSSVDTVSYTYDPYGYNDIYQISFKDSRSANYTKEYKYNYFFGDTPPAYLLPYHFVSIENLYKELGTSWYLVDEKMRSTQLVSGKILFSGSFIRPCSKPVANDGQDYYAVLGDTCYGYYMSNPLSDEDVIEVSNIYQYDDHENPLCVYDFLGKKYNSAIWDTRIGKKIAEISNAAYDSIAYTSFEGPFNSGSDYNKGNWQFSPSNVVYNTSPSYKPPTGRYYYNFLGGTTIQSAFSISTGQVFTISFWSEGTPVPSVKINTTAITMTAQNTVGNWTLYTGTITGNNYPVVLSTGPTIGIDEIRLYPVNASMTTYTYEPLFGPSSVCDERNNIVYYEYDAMGRLKVTRDINGNVLSLTRHAVQGADN